MICHAGAVRRNLDDATLRTLWRLRITFVGLVGVIGIVLVATGAVVFGALLIVAAFVRGFTIIVMMRRGEELRRQFRSRFRPER